MCVPATLAWEFLHTRVCMQMLHSWASKPGQSYWFCTGTVEVKLFWYYSFKVTEGCFEQISSYNRANESSKKSCKPYNVLNRLMGHVVVMSNEVLVPLTHPGGCAECGLQGWILQQG